MNFRSVIETGRSESQRWETNRSLRLSQDAAVLESRRKSVRTAVRTSRARTLALSSGDAGLSSPASSFNDANGSGTPPPPPPPGASSSSSSAAATVARVKINEMHPLIPGVIPRTDPHCQTVENLVETVRRLAEAKDRPSPEDLAHHDKSALIAALAYHTNSGFELHGRPLEMAPAEGDIKRLSETLRACQLTEDQAMERVREYWYKMRLEGERVVIHGPAPPAAGTPPPAAATPSSSSAAAPAGNAHGDPHPGMPRVDRANIGNCACCGIRWVFDSLSKARKCDLWEIRHSWVPLGDLEVLKTAPERLQLWNNCPADLRPFFNIVETKIGREIWRLDLYKDFIRNTDSGVAEAFLCVTSSN
jgi:hypothetical protein